MPPKALSLPSSFDIDVGAFAERRVGRVLARSHRAAGEVPDGRRTSRRSSHHPIVLYFYVHTDAPVQLTFADGAQLTNCGLLSKVGRSTQFACTRRSG